MNIPIKQLKSIIGKDAKDLSITTTLRKLKAKGYKVSAKQTFQELINTIK